MLPRNALMWPTCPQLLQRRCIDKARKLVCEMASDVWEDVFPYRSVGFRRTVQQNRGSAFLNDGGVLALQSAILVLLQFCMMFHQSWK
jgi:hypothetical protein